MPIWKFWRKNQNLEIKRKDLHLETLLTIHRCIENAEYWRYEGVTDLLRKIYWQVEEVMELHPEMKDTQELVEKWMMRNLGQWCGIKTKLINPSDPVINESIVTYRAIGELTAALYQNSSDPEKLEKLEDRVIEQVNSILTRTKNLMSQLDTRQTIDDRRKTGD